MKSSIASRITGSGKAAAECARDRRGAGAQGGGLRMHWLAAGVAFEVGEKFTHGGVTLRPPVSQRLENDEFQAGVELRIEFARRDGVMRLQALRIVQRMTGPDERAAAGEQFVEDCAEGIDVRAFVHI